MSNPDTAVPAHRLAVIGRLVMKVLVASLAATAWVRRTQHAGWAT